MLAVHLLGGASKPVDTEDVAVKAHELAPGRLTWRKYPDQINLELARVFLSDAKKKEIGYLSGTGRTGWRLTKKGMEWARAVEQELPGMELARARQDSRTKSLDENRWRRERSRILGTQAWIRWQEQFTPTSRQAEEVFRIDSYVDGAMREMKVTRLMDLFSDDQEVSPFLAAMSQLVSDEGEEQ